MGNGIAMKQNAALLVMLMLMLPIVDGCSKDDSQTQHSIPLGAILPFSGEQAAVGLNIEQAITLAVEDVNHAGGVDDRMFKLFTRDSNSGTDKGYAQAVELLVDKQLPYLIGPEENGLAKRLVSVVKQQNALNLMPGVAAPTVKYTGQNGAWLRLSPSPEVFGCAMAYSAVEAGFKTAVAVVVADDFQNLLASSFSSFFSEAGGQMLGVINVQSGELTYAKALETVSSVNPELYVVLAYPETAATITADWILSNPPQKNFYLGPTLYTDVFLKNVPIGSLEGFRVFSPSLSLKSECTVSDRKVPESVTCTRENNERFTSHYQQMWTDDVPLPESLFYYDGVVMLALALAHADYDGNANPSPVEIRQYTRDISEPPGIVVSWDNLGEAFALLAEGQDISYQGAAAEYMFQTSEIQAVSELDFQYGVAQHKVVDVWEIKNDTFTLAESVGAYCVKKVE